jgi:hypothetical protein
VENLIKLPIVFFFFAVCFDELFLLPLEFVGKSFEDCGEELVSWTF